MTFIFGEPPEGFRQEMEEFYHRQRSIAHAFDADAKDLFESLNTEHLATLRTIFYTIASAGEEGFSVSRYYEGLIAGILTHVHGVCAGCGHDHAEEFLERATAEESAKESDPEQ